MANADEGRLGIRRIAHVPAKATTLDFHTILLSSRVEPYPAGHATNDK
jgi:hypothetical protein